MEKCPSQVEERNHSGRSIFSNTDSVDVFSVAGHCLLENFSDNRRRAPMENNWPLRRGRRDLCQRHHIRGIGARVSWCNAVSLASWKDPGVSPRYRSVCPFSFVSSGVSSSLYIANSLFCVCFLFIYFLSFWRGNVVGNPSFSSQFLVS